jgi:hypothetical protein
MLDSFIIVGLTMTIVGIIKTFKPFTTEKGKLCVPLLVFAVAAILNVLNAVVFGGELLKALNEGFVLGAAAGGIYSMGKAAIEKYKA